MLKFIYTETALYLELLGSDLEDWVEQRLMFAISTGEAIFVSEEKATFLLPDVVCEATELSLYLDHQGVNTVTVNRCDLDRVEIGLTGYWLSTHLDSVEGIFVTQLPDRVESYLWQLWCSANSLSMTSDGVVG
ncbi:alr0857 family protein [Chamaesiphon sp. VAR_48_metabat_135_sub]|uniref:alr0857 family protein n=1 Tax=Chamaesiphon sp. VAR_48_metabat_135_sub TaxID=2964699 RepID=UPI00286C9955|nr:alr0857 family protein [Chamaesiphon sp. VAR_48_metabat_135_sub]